MARLRENLNPNGIVLHDIVWWHGATTSRTGSWQGCDFAVGRVIAIDPDHGYAKVRCFTDPGGPPVDRCLDGLIRLVFDVPIPRPRERC